MKHWYFFLYSIILMSYIDCAGLSANIIDKHQSKTTEDFNDELIFLGTKICAFFRLGYSPKEVVKLLNEHPSYPAQLAQIIPALCEVLHACTMEHTTINIGTSDLIKNDLIVNNPHAEEYYAQKNFNAKIRRVAIILEVIIVCFVLFKCYQAIAPMFEGFWPFSKKVPGEGILPEKPNVNNIHNNIPEPQQRDAVPDNNPGFYNNNNNRPIQNNNNPGNHNLDYSTLYVYEEDMIDRVIERDLIEALDESEELFQRVRRELRM